MSRVDWLDIAAKCFEATQLKEMHVNDIAKHVVQLGLGNGFMPEIVAVKLSAALSGNVKRKSGQFGKVKNKSGGFKKGIYRVKSSPSIRLIKDSISDVGTNFIGKAGEHAILSELLFRGYNASIMAVDQGIDVVASKNNKYFHIQVKTATGDDTKSYLATIRRETFQHAADTFYIIVLRRTQKQRYMNDYLVLSSHQVMHHIRNRELKDGSSISIRIVVNKEKYLLNGTVDLTHCVNFFDGVC